MGDDDLIRRGDALHLVEDYETIHDRMSLLPAVVQETTATIRELEADRDQWRVDCEEFRRERDAAEAKVARLEGALQAWKAAGTDEEYYKAVQLRKAALTEGGTANE